MVHAALDSGVNFFDTANSYVGGVSEAMLGQALKGRRQDAVIASKVFNPMGGRANDSGMSRLHIKQAVEDSLRRLGTDHIDVYYAHHPDPTTPLDQMLRAFDDLVRQGKIRYPALSNYPAWQLTHALWLCDRLALNPPIAMEMPYHLLNRGIEREVVPACLAFGVGITAYSPLGGGLLSGHYKPGQPPPPGSRAWFRPPPAFPEHQLHAAARLAALAAEWGHLPVQVALAWVLARPGLTSAIVGPETVQQLEELVPAVDLILNPEQVAQLDALA
jgi:aryl-alcohol dehydrogenase-like predicted oxidoreductase